MQHAISQNQAQTTYAGQADGMIAAIEACVHCGFCLPTCPTYLVLGEEMDSPRGRIILMKAALENSIPAADTLPYIDRCLGCMACVTACPSGVRYENLLFPFRNQARQDSIGPGGNSSQKIKRKIASLTMPYPGRFRAAARLGGFVRPATGLLPDDLQSLVRLLPDNLPKPIQLPEVSPAKGKRRARVALLSGCVQQALAPEINQATLNVLTKNGVEVIIPVDQACCGAILHHIGDENGARKLGRQNMRAFAKVLTGEYDALLTNAAGCGSGIKDYAHLFIGFAEEEKAQALAEKTKDISLFLAELGLVPPPALQRPLRVAYHDACHLLHAQGISDAPRRLLQSIEGLTLLPIAQSEICCGSAGTYNFEQPEIAQELGRRKTENILATGCDLVATGNIGCMIQIRQQLRQQNQAIPVIHTIELLDLAYK